MTDDNTIDKTCHLSIVLLFLLGLIILYVFIIANSTVEKLFQSSSMESADIKPYVQPLLSFRLIFLQLFFDSFYMSSCASLHNLEQHNFSRLIHFHFTRK